MRIGSLLWTAILLGGGCGESPKPVVVEPAVPDVPDVTGKIANLPDGGTANAVPTSSAAVRDAKPSCAVKSSSLHEPQTNQCLDGVAPHLGDLRLTLEPEATTVAPGATLGLKLRLVNVSGHTLSIRTTLQAGNELTVVTDKNVRIAPPAGAPVVTPDAACDGMTCSHMEIERGVVVALLPDGIIEDTIDWRASRMVWPPPQKQQCCVPNVVPAIPKSPLPKGKYHTTATAHLWSAHEWLDLTVSADVSVQ